jgi:hypothetical protein
VAHVWLIALASAATYILGHDYDTCKYPARWRIPLQRTILKLSLQRENAKSTSNRVRACGQGQIRSEAIPANKGVLRTETLACIAISPRLQRWSSDPELLIFLAEPPTFVREGSAFRRGARREARGESFLFLGRALLVYCRLPPWCVGQVCKAGISDASRLQRDVDSVL